MGKNTTGNTDLQEEDVDLSQYDMNLPYYEAAENMNLNYWRNFEEISI